MTGSASALRRPDRDVEPIEDARDAQTGNLGVEAHDGLCDALVCLIWGLVD